MRGMESTITSCYSVMAPSTSTAVSVCSVVEPHASIQGILNSCNIHNAKVFLLPKKDGIKFLSG